MKDGWGSTRPVCCNERRRRRKRATVRDTHGKMLKEGKRECTYSEGAKKRGEEYDDRFRNWETTVPLPPMFSYLSLSLNAYLLLLHYLNFAPHTTLELWILIPLQLLAFSKKDEKIALILHFNVFEVWLVLSYTSQVNVHRALHICWWIHNSMIYYNNYFILVKLKNMIRCILKVIKIYLYNLKVKQFFGILLTILM